MATATGWGALPISLSFGDSIKSLVSELNGPVAKAAKNAGGSIEKEIGNASKKAADQYEKQQWRMEKATKEKTAAEENHRLKLLEQQRAQTALENAEKDLADARESGGKKARDAQLRYEAAQIKVEKSTIATRKASDKLDGSIDEVSKATESAEQAFKDMEKAQDDTGNSAKSLRDRVREMGEEAGETGGIFEGLGGKIGGALKGLAIGGVASLGAASAGLVKFGSDFDDAFDTIRIGTGASGEAFEDLKESAKSVADSVPAMDGGFGQISSTMADLNTRLGLTDEPLENMTGQFVQLANMGIDADINDVSQALSGFGVEATDAPAALDELFQISQATGLTITELSNSAVKAGPALRGFGFGLGESAALAGQLDKAGLDADKTMTSMTRALTEFASEGRDAPAALQETVDQIDSFIASGDDAAAMDLAAGLFGTRGASQFVDAVKTGTLSVEDLVGATGATSDTIMGVADETADFAESWQLFKQKSMDAIQPVATALFDRLAPALERASDWIFDQLVPAMSDLWEHIQPLVEKGFVVLSDALDTVWRVVSEDLVPTFRRFIGWMKDNREVIQSVAVGAGVLAGGLALMNVQQKILMAGGVVKWMKSWTVATNIQAAAQRLLNTVMKANPIGLIITAVAALAAGLVYFFTKTETGRELWEKFTSFLSDAWQNVSEKFAEGIDWISEKWDSFTSFMGDLWETIKASVFDAWTNTIEGIRDGWDTFTGAISGGWTWLKDTLVNVWTTVRDAVLGAFEWYINRLKNTFEKVTGALSAAWTWLKDGLLNVWNTIKDKVVNAFVNAWQNLRTNFENGIGLIGDSWQWLKDALWDGYDWIRANVFDKFKDALDTLQGWFDKGVEGIGRIWDGLKDAAKKPVKFVVDTVWNNGLLKAINAVTGFIGMDKIEPIDIGFRKGGILPGWSRMADGDNRLVPMRDGEGVLVSEGLRDNTSRDMFLAANEHAKRGGSFASFVNEMGSGFATGGILNLAGALSGVQESHARFVAKFFPDLFALTSASRTEPGSFHDYGAQKATDWQAQDGQFATQMPTPNSKALARAIYTNFPNSAELIHWPLDGWQNLDEGSPYDFGAGTNAGHANHVHWATHSPLQFDGDDITLTDAGGGGSDGSFVKRIWDGIVDKISPFDKGAGGWFADVPGTFVKSAAGKLWDFVSEKVKSVFSFIGGGGGADQWSDLALVALKRMGYGEEHLPAMLQQIQIESGGNPSSVNMWDENAVRGTPSGGLLQVIEPTYRRVRNAYPDAFEGLPDDRMEPITNLTAGVGAVKMDWGGPAGRWPTRDGYTDGGIVDLPNLFDTGGVWRDGTMGVNLSGSDEVVFNNRQWQLLKQVLNTVPVLTKSQEKMVDELGAALNEPARKSAEDYAAEQAGGFLSTWGLEGLVPLAQKAGGMAWDAYVSNPVDVAMTPGGVTAYARKQGVQAEVNRGGATVTIEAESDEDLIRVSQFKQLASQVDWLKVKVERKPKAGARTRGGVM